MNDTIPGELRAPLPADLQPAHDAAIQAYLAAVAAAGPPPPQKVYLPWVGKGQV